MSAKTTDVLVRFPNETVELLKAEKARTHEPTSNFIRRAVTCLLKRPTLDNYFGAKRTAAPREYRPWRLHTEKERASQ
jgi:hypothetical protein